MWAEAHVRNAVGRLPDTTGALSFDDYMIGEQQQLLGHSMAEKEVYLGVQVQTRSMVDRVVERAAPVLRRVFPTAVDAELVAIDAEVEHLDGVIGVAGLEGRPVTAGEMSWLMHRSCSLGLPAPRNLPAAPGASWEPEDLASFTDAADFHTSWCSPWDRCTVCASRRSTIPGCSARTACRPGWNGRRGSTCAVQRRWPASCSGR